MFDESTGPFPALRKTSSFSQQNKAKSVLYPLTLLNSTLESHSLAAPFKAPIFLGSEWNSLPFSGCELAQTLICVLKKSQTTHTGHPADTGRSPCSRQSITRVCSSKFQLFLQVELLITALECFVTVPIHRLSSATRCWNSTR